MIKDLYPESLDRHDDLELADGGGVLLFDPVPRAVLQLRQLRWQRLKELAAQIPER